MTKTLKEIRSKNRLRNNRVNNSQIANDEKKIPALKDNPLLLTNTSRNETAPLYGTQNRNIMDARGISCGSRKLLFLCLAGDDVSAFAMSVSYTHLTLPTKA